MLFTADCRLSCIVGQAKYETPQIDSRLQKQGRSGKNTEANGRCERLTDAVANPS